MNPLTTNSQKVTRTNTLEITVGQLWARSSIRQRKKLRKSTRAFAQATGDAWLRKVEKIPSGSGRDAVPFAGDYANLGWLEQHRGHRTRSSILNRADSDDLNESQSPETEDKEDEQDARLDFVEDQVDVIKFLIGGGDREKQTKIHTLTQTNACTGKELNEKESQRSTQQTTLKVIYEMFLQ